MKKFVTLFLFVTFLFAVNANAQTPQPTPKKQTQVQPANDEDVVRITTTLIQIDAVVTDSKGRQITNLRPEDFEILENGKKQKITNFSYITNTPTQTTQPADNKAAKSNSPVPVSQKPLNPEQVRRTIVLLVDDSALSAGNTKEETITASNLVYMRKALKKFVDEQMQEGDLVALIRTSGGVGILQQLTSSKQKLYRAIEQMRVVLNGSDPRSIDFEALTDVQTDESSGTRDRIGEKNISREIVNQREKLFTEGALFTLEYVIQGLRDLPGRKAVMFFSPGFNVFPGFEELLKKLTDKANRAGVVIYGIDATGLQPAGLTAEDSYIRDDFRRPPVTKQAILSGQYARSILRARQRAILNTQYGLKLISEPTGGFVVKNTNDIDGGIKKVLNDQAGYYLIGYQPDESTFDPKQNLYNNLKVKLKNSGLNIRYRSGFFGIKDEERKAPAPLTPPQQVTKALYSPFAASGVNLGLTTVFTNEETVGSHIRSLIYIEANDLSFTKDENGYYKTIVDVVAITVSSNNGATVDRVSEVHKLSLSEEDYNRALKQGLVYSLNVPIKKAGAYHLRIVVRDEQSEKMGSVNEFIEIPDLGKDELSLSSLIVSGDGSLKGSQSSTIETDPLMQAARRRFHTDTVLQYGYFIYNAKLDKNLNNTNLTTQLRLYRDGKEVFTGKELPFDAKDQTDLKRLQAGGAIKLEGLPAGEYVLQVIVTDALAKEKYRTSSRWIEFELIK